jgi:autotransporter-associated beta strand protein
MTTLTKQAAQTIDELSIGDGATYCGWSDRQAGTIIAKTATTITWQRDKATLLNGSGSGEADALEFSPGGFSGHTSGSQRYSYERDTDGITRKFTKRGDGTWRLSGAKTGATLIAGRSEHYDFNF